MLKWSTWAHTDICNNHHSFLFLSAFSESHTFFINPSRCQHYESKQSLFTKTLHSFISWDQKIPQMNIHVMALIVLSNTTQATDAVQVPSHMKTMCLVNRLADIQTWKICREIYEGFYSHQEINDASYNHILTFLLLLCQARASASADLSWMSHNHHHDHA